jgi:LytS/YehU family sensor histidine kinase
VPRYPAIPLLFLLFQLLIFVAAITINAQRERNHSMALNLRQAQVNLLRSQSNPHFLFNTLNLLASEIGRNAANAREIVYDLADLLRESIKAGESSCVSIAEEMRLATLYLRLQEKRFPDRFSFEVKVEPEVSGQQIPALLLQPGVENAIKHAVARTRKHVHLTLAAERIHDQVLLTVMDTGGEVEVSPSETGDGLRIIGETLELYYRGQHSMKFDCSEAGARLSICIPFATEPEILHG